MTRTGWMLALPLLAALAWAGRAAPLVDSHVRDQEWLVSDAGTRTRYGGVDWTLDRARLLRDAPALAPGQQALVVDMTLNASDPFHQLMDCRQKVLDARGRSWPALDVRERGRMARALLSGEDEGDDCAGVGFVTPRDARGPIRTKALFLLPDDAAPPLRLRLSIRDGRPRAVDFSLSPEDG